MNSRVYKEEDYVLEGVVPTEKKPRGRKKTIKPVVETETVNEVKPKKTTRKKTVKSKNKDEEVILTAPFTDINSDNILKESINEDIDNKLKKNKKPLPTGDSHRERRLYLRYATDYFKMKKKLNLYQWAELVRDNIKRGKEKHQLFVESNNKEQIDFLIDREMKYRDTLKLLKTSEKDIETAIEKWYSVVIKEGSPLMVK